MEIIPVIDLKGGQAVLARKGERESYQPVRSPLVDSSDPVAVVEAYRSVHDFARLYVADLDAIAGGPDHTKTLAALRSRFPDIELWVDNGLADPEACRDWLAQDSGRLVLGSESQSGADTLHALESEARRDKLVLSLDFSGDAFIGPSALLEDSTLWPQDVIVMTLARVGSGLGPDEERLRTIRSRAGDRRVFAAGGVRGLEDLQRLKAAGIAGALVASVLHDKRLGRAEIESLG